ncbi:MAG TPA: hypothetical protein VM261_02415 [Kofleriaceae bacterium]|nr:hypothetical protein [Kofleriaceae bacterium]
MRTVVATVLVLLAAADATAQTCPPDAAARATALRARLDRERSKVKRWRIGWAIGYTVLAGGQLALVLTETAPTGEFDDAQRASLIVGTAKAALGAATRGLKTIKNPRPAVTGDACADLAAAEAAFELTARTERKGFMIGHIANLAVHTAGSIYIGLAEDDAWDEAALSFLTGYAVSLAATYTMPRGAWKEHQRASEARTWQVAPLITPRMRGLAVAWTFE